MTTFHIAVIICTSINQRGVAGVTQMSDDTFTTSMNNAAMLGPDLERASDGQATFSTDVIVWPHTIGEEVFRDYAPTITYPNPDPVAAVVGITNQYDVICVMSDYAVPTQTNFRALQNANGWWVLAADRDARLISIHEFGHWMEWRLKQLGYQNWPDCGNEPGSLKSIHCNSEYGFQTNWSFGWLHGFFTGTLYDGTGINATGWALQTPIERGVRVIPDTAEAVLSPWSDKRVFHILPV